MIAKLDKKNTQLDQKIVESEASVSQMTTVVAAPVAIATPPLIIESGEKSDAAYLNDSVNILISEQQKT